MFDREVTLEEFASMPAEYQEAVNNILTIHTVSELYGADVFYRWIPLAPTPVDKWRMSQILREEYGHHLRFAKLQTVMGVDVAALTKDPLSLFTTYDADNWAEAMMFLATVDRAARLQFEDFTRASFLPLRDVAERTLKEEIGHAEFGRTRVTELCRDPVTRAQAQRGIEKWFPMAVSFFGRSGSPKGERYVRWGLKRRSNDEMRRDYLAEYVPIVEAWGLTLPAVSDLDRHLEHAG
jgi:ring-1,2-phenylacetyl-CoA epoxidase subunit PaaA